jgi:hypothetical protein
VSPDPEVTEDLEEKFYPEEIVGHSLPNKRKLRSRTAPTEYLVKVKWLDYPHEQNTDEPLLAFGKLKKSKGYDQNIGNVIPNLIADYAHNNDLFDVENLQRPTSNYQCLPRQPLPRREACALLQASSLQQQQQFS